MRVPIHLTYFFLQHHTEHDDTRISMQNLFNEIININCWLFYTHFWIVIILKLLNGRNNVKIQWHTNIGHTQAAKHFPDNLHMGKNEFDRRTGEKHMKMPKKAVNSSMKNAVICAKPIKFMGNTCARRFFFSAVISLILWFRMCLNDRQTFEWFPIRIVR